MLFSLVYFLVGRILGTGRCPDEGREIELLVLRHQVSVLQRQVKRPRLRRLDRLLLAAASKAMPRARWSSFVVRPETLLRWHRELVRRKWTYKRRGHPGRPPIEPEIRGLIVLKGTETPIWLVTCVFPTNGGETPRRAASAGKTLPTIVESQARRSLRLNAGLGSVPRAEVLPVSAEGRANPRAEKPQVGRPI